MESSFLMYSSKTFEARSAILLLTPCPVLFAGLGVAGKQLKICKIKANKLSPKSSITHFKALLGHTFYCQSDIKSFILELLADFLGCLRIL